MNGDCTLRPAAIISTGSITWGGGEGERGEGMERSEGVRGEEREGGRERGERREERGGGREWRGVMRECERGVTNYRHV